ncbi:MAG: Txe/YoeB family addiction module toxin [Mucilaginibacter sp.]|uniref:Txe/YoeB family addiction module toxin n=1 Tax=Mucilaginibacter sp. TaxID=1882438 RepID=UPI0032636B2A
MEIVYAPKALKDLEFWKRSGNKSIQKKIQQIIDSIQESPFEGIGKPEPLKHNLSGKWSRRISHEHRIIYSVSDEKEIEILAIFSLKGHY